MIEKTQVNVKDDRTVGFLLNAIRIGSFFRRYPRDSQQTEGLRDIWIKTTPQSGYSNSVLCVNLNTGASECLQPGEIVNYLQSVTIDVTTQSEV